MPTAQHMAPCNHFVDTRAQPVCACALARRCRESIQVKAAVAKDRVLICFSHEDRELGYPAELRLYTTPTVGPGG